MKKTQSGYKYFRQIFAFTRGFKWRVIIKVAAIFFINWALLLALFFYDAKRDFIEESESKALIYIESFRSISDVVKKQLSDTLSTVIDNVQNPSGDATQISKRISQTWNSFNKPFSSMQLEFFDSHGKPIEQWETVNRIRNPIALPSHLLGEAEQYQQGLIRIECKQICSLVIIRTLLPFSKGKGLLRLSITIDDVINHFSLLQNIHVVAYRYDAKQDTFNHESSTSFLLQNKVADSLDFSDVSQYVMIRGRKQSHIAYKNNRYLNDGLYFFYIEDITYRDNALSQKYIHAFWWSLLALTLMMIVLYLLLNRTMVNIKNLSYSLPFIGQAKFALAKKSLKEHLPVDVVDEIDQIHSMTYEMTDQLEELHDTLESRNKELQYLANHDTMTSMPNRRRFQEEIESYCSNKENKVVLVILDIDHFKVVNDVLGHLTGDELIISVGNILQDVMRGAGFVARMGGDEFAITAKVEGGFDIAPYLCSISEKASAIKLTSDTRMIRPISVSLGVAYFPHDSEDLEELFSLADVAMYENKKLKQGAFHIYNGQEMLLKAQMTRKHWDTVIQDALKENRLIAYYQPLCDAKTKTIEAYEVLTRIIDDNDEVQYIPNDFIDYAEKNRMIINIDRQIIEIAIAYVSQTAPGVKLMINLSNLTLGSLGLKKYILDIVHKYHYSPNLITFEITENSEIENVEQAQRFMHEMSNEGFGFALDDFGAGFSSFLYLEKLDFDYLKIDKRVVAGLMDREKNASVFKSIVQMANNLGIEVVVEGVESKEILDEMEKYDHIRLLQGYYLHRPGAHISYDRAQVVRRNHIE